MMILVAKGLMSASDLLLLLDLRETNVKRFVNLSAWNMKPVVLEDNCLMVVPRQK
jgi:hypothetical protein